jgi:hypothetical protein
MIASKPTTLELTRPKHPRASPTNLLHQQEFFMTNFFLPNFSIPGSTSTVRLYCIATGLFTALFAGSIVLGLGDLNESYIEYTRLGFTAHWQVFFNSFGKLLGLLAIFHNRSRTLKDFAFAGFFFDLLLALFGHIAQGEI